MKISLLLLVVGLGGLASAALAQEAIPAGPQAAMPAPQGVGSEPPSGPADHLPQGGRITDPSPSDLPYACASGVRGCDPSAGRIAPQGGPRLTPQRGTDGGCEPASAEEKRPHGEVWAGVGTGGYREAGAVVTKRLGDCAEVTIGVDDAHVGPVRGPRR